MIPKKYFEDNRGPIDPNYIFALLPYELQHIYEEGISKPIQSISESMGIKLVCENSFEISGPGDIMADVWSRIQKSQVIIADITGFNPNVMYELGVTLTQKDNVIIICDISIKGKTDIPFDINHLRIDFYDPTKLDALSTKLIQTITEILKTAGFKTEEIKNQEVKKLLKTANELRRDNQWIASLALFEQMNTIEPKNWVVNKQWGITYSMKGDYEAANQKFHEAIEYATVNDQKSEIYTELALLHKKNNSDQALSFFRQAESLNSNNAFLYRQWAQFYEERNKYDEAMAKMQIAVRLDNKDDRNKTRLEYYTQKFLDPTLSISFSAFERNKKGKIKPPGPTGRNYNPDWDFFVRKYQEGDQVDCIIDNINPRLGIFVRIFDDVQGLIHIRNLPNNFERIYSEGKRIKVEINQIDKTNHRLDLLLLSKQSQSHRSDSNWDTFINKYSTGDVVRGTIKNINTKFGMFVYVFHDISGLIHKSRLPGNFENQYSTNEQINVKILGIDKSRERVDLLLDEHDSNNEQELIPDEPNTNKCSQCNADLVKRKTKSGKDVLVCANYPKCKNLSYL